ncbi:hypothetical protein NSK_001940 [Nannochloropsis salina CCMP1776]|uniref:GPI-anchor transamidase n=1 Tax=Nannochloropsis salina CCMP1776 TaxID=1027361 RepID=A0A4D9D5L2_9STRA|nr:hypothetical protein NSK_001940 [Nannochloropsis salina CCMP1776]|eukprot:TFJ86852.1 hypothetical protein NSK_001940 [Nannochloropsis salina CCMP1776]
MQAAWRTVILGLYWRLGVPDSQIVLMLADDIPCNARNARPGGVYHSTTHTIDLCANGLEVDYKNEEVTVGNFVRVLTGRHPPGWPISKRLGSSNTSRVLIYMTGHGGDEFLKFHNHEEISSEDLAHTLQDMKTAGRYQDLFFVVDTCQGGTLFRRFRTPGVLAVGSSGQGENSFAHQNDMVLGVALVDRFTDASCQYLHKLADRATAPQLSSPLGLLSQVPLSMLLGSYNPVQLKSTPVLRSDLFEASREDEAEEVGGLGDRNVAYLSKGSYITHANTQAAAPPCRGTGSDLGPQKTLLNKTAIY